MFFGSRCQVSFFGVEEGAKNMIRTPKLGSSTRYRGQDPLIWELTWSPDPAPTSDVRQAAGVRDHLRHCGLPDGPVCGPVPKAGAALLRLPERAGRRLRRRGGRLPHRASGAPARRDRAGRAARRGRRGEREGELLADTHLRRLPRAGIFRAPDTRRLGSCGVRARVSTQTVCCEILRPSGKGWRVV